MDFVLNLLEEFNRNFSLRIIINTGRIYLQYLTIEHFFRCTDITDTLKQFLEISTAAQFFQAVVVHCKAFFNVLFQYICCPDTKLHTTLGFNTITDRDDYIEIIIINCPFDLSVSLILNRCKFCNS